MKITIEGVTMEGTPQETIEALELLFKSGRMVEKHSQSVFFNL